MKNVLFLTVVLLLSGCTAYIRPPVVVASAPVAVVQPAQVVVAQPAVVVEQPAVMVDTPIVVVGGGYYHGHERRR